MVQLSFKKRDLNESDLPAIHNIFSGKPASDGIAMTCLPVYRDILVFMNKGQISGMAKICFGCHDYHFVGAKADTQGFGSDGEFAKLKRLLHQASNY